MRRRSIWIIDLFNPEPWKKLEETAKFKTDKSEQIERLFAPWRYSEDILASLSSTRLNSPIDVPVISPNLHATTIDN